jgi:hypothetical protein
VPMLDDIAFGVPLLSLNDKRTLFIVARAEVRASNDVTTRVRIVFFIWFVLADLGGFKKYLLCGSVRNSFRAQF